MLEKATKFAVTAAVFSIALFSASLSVRGEGRGAVGSIYDKVGQRVVVAGKVSQIPWQHMIGTVPGKTPIYFDLAGGNQVVAYASGSVPESVALLLWAKVFRLEGESKRPGDRKVVSEVQLDVERWLPLDRKGVESVLDTVSDSEVPRVEKEQVEDALMAAGKDPMPGLVAHIDDRRVCWTERVLANEGEMMNRPVNAPPVQEKWVQEEFTVGAFCDHVLLHIIYPEGYESPFAAHFKPLSGGPPYRVEDWTAWWARNKEKPLPQIRDEMKPVVDAYFKARGIQQVLR